MVDRNLVGLGPLASPSVVAVLRLANLGVEHGYLDPSPYNEAGAAYFVCGQPGGPEQAVLVMVSGRFSGRWWWWWAGGGPQRIRMVGLHKSCACAGACGGQPPEHGAVPRHGRVSGTAGV